MNFEEFKKDRNEALLSMDKNKIIAYLNKYQDMKTYATDYPENDKIFWCGVHKARTGCTDLPMSERMISKDWLSERGYESLDDGELTKYRSIQ